jgi:hypothetical protein
MVKPIALEERAMPSVSLEQAAIAVNTADRCEVALSKYGVSVKADKTEILKIINHAFHLGHKEVTITDVVHDATSMRRKRVLTLYV